MSDKLANFFNEFIKKEPIFKNKKALQSNYTPDEVPYREKQIKQVASILAPALRSEKPSNVFIYGKTGCIAGESLVYTNQGYVKIKEINQNSMVLTFNLKTKKYEWSPFIFLRYQNKDRLLKIVLDNGFNLTLTKDHPLLFSSMVWKKADEFKINDEIIVGYDLPNINKNEISLAMARILGFVISDGSLNRRRRRVKDGRGNFYNSDKQRLRYFSADFILLNKFKDDLNLLYHYTPRIVKDKNRCPAVQVISQEICQNLNLYGIPFGAKSSIVEVPEIIFKSSNIIQREFLKALFSGDGTVSRHTYQIEYYSNSEKLLEGISYLLHQEGIACKIISKLAKLNGKTFKSYRLYINGQENLIKFFWKIGFYSEIKQNKLKILLNKYLKKMKFNQNNYIPARIVGIEEVYEPYVYDLKVPINHNFIANGIISHNSGKTCVIQYVTNKILESAKKNKVELNIFYLNCKLKRVADTEYRLIAQLNRMFGINVPATGLPTDEVYKLFMERLDRKKMLLILVLDEIDQLVGKIGDEILYNLTRLNSELKNSEISLIGISNDLVFTDNLDPRVKSSLSEEEIVFPPYNAVQLQKILKQRASIAFREEVIGEGVIEKCAAYAAREHGDARRALELLRVAGEIGERENKVKIEVDHLDEAEEKIERDKILDLITTQPKQFKITLHSIFEVCLKESKKVYTGDVYEAYKECCSRCGVKPLTQRRVSDIIAELDMLGIINARVISKGRYGRTREISLAISKSSVPNLNSLLEEGLGYG